jgi:hypothetical protein
MTGQQNQIASAQPPDLDHHVTIKMTPGKKEMRDGLGCRSLASAVTRRSLCFTGQSHHASYSQFKL